MPQPSPSFSAPFAPAAAPLVCGIPNCDTVRRVRALVAARFADYQFVDFKKTPPTPEHITQWLTAADLDWTALLNRRGTAWRGLDAQVQARVVDAPSAAAVMAAHPSTIRRPLIIWPTGAVTIGADAAQDMLARL